MLVLCPWLAKKIFPFRNVIFCLTFKISLPPDFFLVFNSNSKILIFDFPPSFFDSIYLFSSLWSNDLWGGQYQLLIYSKCSVDYRIRLRIFLSRNIWLQIYSRRLASSQNICVSLLHSHILHKTFCDFSKPWLPFLPKSFCTESCNSFINVWLSPRRQDPGWSCPGN